MNNCNYSIILHSKKGFIEIKDSNEIIKNNTMILDESNLKTNMIYINSNHILREYTKIDDGSLILIPTLDCNEKCIICPQEIIHHDINSKNIALIISKHVNYKTIKSIYITGGEPLIESATVESIIRNVPMNIPIFILTNGNIKISESLLSLVDRIFFCIPLYGSTSEIHNRITESNGFYNTIQNMYKLAEVNAKIELRFVITKMNYKNLINYAYYLFNNMPFIMHVSFMGMELMESAKKNQDNLWIEPKEYMPILESAIDFLLVSGIDIKLYNIPLCVISPKYRKYSSISISTWKRKYFNECSECIIKGECGGVFISTFDKYANLIITKRK